MPPKKKAEEPDEEPEEDVVDEEAYKLGVAQTAQDPKTLKYLLESPELPVVISSVQALHKFAEESPGNRTHLKDIGVISAVMVLLQGKSVELQVNVAMLLEKLAIEESNRPELVERGALAAFLDHLVGKNLDLRSIAATACEHLSEDEVTRQSFYRAHAIAADCKADVEEDKAEKKDRGPSPPRQRGLPEPPLSDPASPPRNRATGLLDSKQYPKRIDCLERATMGCLAMPKRAKDKPDLPMISKGLTIVFNFCDDCIARHELCDLGCIPVLTALVSLELEDAEDEAAKLDEIKIKSAQSLEKLASELTIRPLMQTTTEIKDFGCVGPLAKLHDASTNAEVRAACSGALANLALDAQSRLDILQCYGPAPDHVFYGVSKGLVLRLHEGEGMEQFPCAKGLARISAQSLGCDALVGAGALEHVIALISGDNIARAGEGEAASPQANLVLDAVTIAANCMTRPLPAPNDKIRQLFADGGGLEAAVSIIGAEKMHAKIIETSLYTIMHLVETATCRRKAEELEICTHFPRLLQHQVEGVRQAAALVLATMAYEQASRQSILSVEAVEPMMSLLEDKAPEVQQAALFAITNCVRSAEIRAKVVTEMGLGKHLVRLLDMVDTDVLKNALRCTCAIATDGVNAVQLCFDGVLQKAEFHKTSRSKAVKKYASETLSRILNSNLPAKVWLRGVLDAGDRVECGFYDVGKYDKWLPLQDLRASKPNPFRPEILLWDPENDPVAKRWIDEATEGVAQCTSEILEQVSWLAKYVARQMGGEMSPEDYFSFDFAMEVRKAKRQAGSNVLPLGDMKLGGTRHRALLLKILCDYCDVDCTMKRGPFSRGAHAFHSWNTVVTETNETFIIDVVFSPGTVYLETSQESQQYQCKGEYAFSSLCQD